MRIVQLLQDLQEEFDAFIVVSWLVPHEILNSICTFLFFYGHGGGRPQPSQRQTRQQGRDWLLFFRHVDPSNDLIDNS